MICRREFLALSGSAVAGAMMGLEPARARMAPATSQVPGFYRFNLGKVQVTVVSDGTITFPTEVLWPTPSKEERTAALAADHQPTDELPVQMNTIVVNTGDKLVLVDVGTRGKVWPTSGRLLTNLKAAGIAPDDIDTVLITHAHPDHLWGVLDQADAELTFPNADYAIGETELNYWMQPQHPLANDADWGEVYAENMKTLPKIKDKLRTVKPGAEALTGISVVATPGHTPGHLSVQIASGSDALFCTADCISNRLVSFEHPDWPLGFDLDGDQGVRTRNSVLDRCATDKILISSFHLPFPGLGHVVRAGSAYRYLPIDFAWNVEVPT